jgi:prepilin-type N-terminal cleavage/methylation domain-containing protein
LIYLRCRFSGGIVAADLTAQRRSNAGFTLIEMAVAVFIISLLLGSILVPLTVQVNQRKISDTQKMLEEIKEALTGFAIVNGYLPCPAVSATNGAEDRVGNVCSKRQGFIPWATLGASKLDGWGHVIRYSVTPAYTSSAPPFSLSTAADITILTRNSAGALVNLSNLNAIPAVVMSYGQNGYGGVNDAAAAVALPTGWPGSFPDENTNATNGSIFVSRILQEAGAGGIGGEFDDVVAWLSPHILFNRMVAAGKLP